MDRDTKLGILANAILEGQAIDWHAASSDTDERDRAIVRELQVVAGIAALHRSLPDADAPSAPDVTETAAAGGPAIAWGHLRLFEMVGRGTFGEVYRAWDTQLDREVALKLLRAGSPGGDPSRSLGNPSRVVHEGRLLARVRHPHVITVFGAEPRDGRVGIWMEFIRGRTLHQIVAEQGPLGPREAAALGSDLCQALAAVHAAGLLHRDVTARNVMREEGGRVVLMDFGAGHEDTGSGRPGDMTGTPLYMAPELFAGAPADQRTDIYALGVILYYLVSGRYPVAGRSFADIRDAHQRGAQVRLRDVRANLPAAFVRAVEKATAPDRAQRCQTVGELESMLGASLVSGRDEARTPAAPRRRLAAAVAAAAVITSGVAIGLYKPWRTDFGDGSGSPTPAALADVTARKVSLPREVSLFSNPSDDGRFVAGMMNATGDAAIVEIATGQARALGMGKGDWSDGYASILTLSPDGSSVAVCWWDNDNRGSLRVARTDGGKPRVLIDGVADVLPYQWSRDGSLILAAIVGKDDVMSIALVAAADGAVRRVATLDKPFPNMMTLSADNRYIVYDHPEAARSVDRDLFMLDTHTGSRWSLVASPGQDMLPLWAPGGGEILFFSDRSRTLSAWVLPIENGRAAGEPRLVKDDVGRIWPRGFTRDGGLHYDVGAGFAEVYLGTLDGSDKPAPISPRQALSNFYPEWSPDGRFVAYTSERTARSPRELWIHDAVVGREDRVPLDEQLGRPFGWSPDGREILVSGPGNGMLYVVDRITAAARVIDTKSFGRSFWRPEGIVSLDRKSVLIRDPRNGQIIRRYDWSDPSVTGVSLGIDGRSALALGKEGRLSLREIGTGGVREWVDPAAGQVVTHAMAPQLPVVAYTTAAKDAAGPPSAVVKIWSPQFGEPRELLRVPAGESVVLAGWASDGLAVLALRWTPPAANQGNAGVRTLWRLPVDGGEPAATPLAMDALRDLSVHPDGRRIAFNAGFKRIEHWVLEHVLTPEDR